MATNGNCILMEIVPTAPKLVSIFVFIRLVLTNKSGYRLSLYVASHDTERYLHQANPFRLASLTHHLPIHGPRTYA